MNRFERNLTAALPAVALVACSLVLGVFAGGCSSSGKRAGEAVKATESMQAVHNDLAKTQTQIDKVVASIDQLQAGADLKKSYANFSESVDDLKGSGDRVKDRADSMRANREAYIKKWQKELDATENAEIRAALVERKAKVSANYDRIRDAGQKVRTDYQPFMKNLQEINKALALDLNPAGVSAMSKPLGSAKTQAATLKSDITALQAELAEIAGKMSPPTPAK